MHAVFLIQLAIISYFILPAIADDCPKIDVLGQSVYKVTSPDIDEASGLVASQALSTGFNQSWREIIDKCNLVKKLHISHSKRKTHNEFYGNAFHLHSFHFQK